MSLVLFFFDPVLVMPGGDWWLVGKILVMSGNW